MCVCDPKKLLFKVALKWYTTASQTIEKHEAFRLVTQDTHQIKKHCPLLNARNKIICRETLFKMNLTFIFYHVHNCELIALTSVCFLDLCLLYLGPLAPVQVVLGTHVDVVEIYLQRYLLLPCRHHQHHHHRCQRHHHQSRSLRLYCHHRRLRPGGKLHCQLRFRKLK